MYKIEAYHCDYCKKYSKSKGVITSHEKKCFYRPETKSCATCRNYHIKEHRYSQPNVDGVIVGYITEIPVCVKGIKFFDSEPEQGKPFFQKSTLKTGCGQWEQQDESEDDYL